MTVIKVKEALNNTDNQLTDYTYNSLQLREAGAPSSVLQLPYGTCLKHFFFKNILALNYKQANNQPITDLAGLSCNQLERVILKH